MKAIIQKKTILEEVYSASGLEYIDGKIYIIGDDSPFLYIYDLTGKLEKKVSLFIPSSQSEERIPKVEKPDLETLSFLTYEGKEYLLTLGSGSGKKTRSKGFLIELKSFEITVVSLSELFDELQKDKNIVGEGVLNIEGLCATEEEVILLTRGNISGLNITLKYDLQSLLGHLIKNEKIPVPTINEYNLPAIEGWLSGFSGAAFNKIKDNILFTATVEKTTNEIDDGETLGSFIGEIPLKEEKTEVAYCPILENGETYLGKVESVAILESTETVRALAVTDNDGGKSELLWIEIIYDL